MSAENRAYERSNPGTGNPPAPIYQHKTADVVNGWRVYTPPIALEVSLLETYDELIARQGRADNVSGQVSLLT